MREVLICGYLRAFSETVVTVDDDFDAGDGDALYDLWRECADLNEDLVELLEVELEVQ